MFTALAEAAVAWAARAVDRLYVGDPYWLSAVYAEPWRTVAIAFIAVLSFVVSIRAAMARRRPSWPRLLVTAATLVSGFAMCLELATAVHMNGALGELYVHTLMFRRDKVSLGRGERSDCVRADFRPFVWRLNGTSIHPRLLPLPYESSAVVRRLSNACPGAP